MPVPTTDKEALRLYLAPVTHVTGEELKGEVHLNFEALRTTPIEEVSVTFHGQLTVEITYGRRSSLGELQLIKASQSLWKKGRSYPSAGEHILKLPFQFLLPATLLPSCTFNTRKQSAAIKYSVTVLGVRPGLRLRTKINRPVSVLPCHRRGAQIRDIVQRDGFGTFEQLRLTWDRKIRRGIWGDLSTVSATISLPKVDVYPVFTPIPFSIRVTTMTRIMHRSEATGDKAIFPAPPATSEGVELTLMRHVILRASDRYSEAGVEPAGSLGGFGPSTSPEDRSHIQMCETSILWTPLSEDQGLCLEQQRGRWTQQILFASELTLRCAPAFKNENFTVTYAIALKIPFSGIGNDLRGEFPVEVVSSFHPPNSRSGSNWARPPPEVEPLPVYRDPSMDRRMSAENEIIDTLG